jgi:hypothetical protein
MQAPGGFIHPNCHLSRRQRLSDNVHNAVTSRHDTFNSNTANPAAIGWLSAALRMKQGLVQLNGVTAIGLSQAMHDLGSRLGLIASVIKTFSHGCPPLSQDSILILSAAIIPPLINALLPQGHK